MRWNSKAALAAWASLLAVAALPLAAWAGHGKAGLWHITVTMGGAQSRISAADMARMKAMGIDVGNNHTISTQRCMTQKEVNSDALSDMQQLDAGCTLTNKQHNGQTYSADMVCTGERMQGKGHFVISYDSPEHYTARMNFSGTAQGQPANVTNYYDGRWVSPHC